MYPDKRLGQDLAIILVSTLFCAIVLAISSFDYGYAPKDECANTVINSLSPYQVSQLINGDMPSNYGEVALWCSDHLDDWQNRLEDARDYPLTPHTLDMMF